ncbi:MAG TPA: phosphoribosylanthranilate isomerase [Solirubrobacteraceae bacterium]|nr:phosphoribosylanthranilate isomerase [Solirubrobacteraceae bacterium]
MSETAPQVKVCGITSLHDAELAVELGAWAVGMIFYAGSPRACANDEALRIVAALRRKVELCGVFVNSPLDEVVQACDELGLTMLQLHGDEGPAYCAEAGHRTGAKVIKAVQVESIGEVRDVERFHTDFHLLDARSTEMGRRELRGGTGEAFDWRLLAARRSRVPLILSGGLGPENAAQAILAASSHGHRARPFALDTASGTEAAPGRKDPERLRAFFAAVRDCAPVGTAPVGPAPVGPAPVGTAPVGPAPVGPAPVGPAPVGPAPVGPPPVGTPA